MKYYNICAKKEYEQNGEKKKKWLPVGTLRVTDDSKSFIELNHLPNTPLYVFEQKPKEATSSPEDIEL